MRKITLYILVVIIASAGTPLQELYKIPALIGHYSSHYKTSQLDVADFFYLHYAQQSSHSNRPHDSLPLKKFDKMSYQVMFFEPSKTYVEVEVTELPEYFDHNQIQLQSQLLHSLLKPPRFS